MDGWVRVLHPFNSISVISRQWKSEHERLYAMKRCLGSGRISTPAGFEPATPWSEVWSANHSATWTLLSSSGCGWRVNTVYTISTTALHFSPPSWSGGGRSGWWVQHSLQNHHHSAAPITWKPSLIKWRQEGWMEGITWFTASSPKCHSNHLKALPHQVEAGVDGGYNIINSIITKVPLQISGFALPVAIIAKCEEKIFLAQKNIIWRKKVAKKNLL